MEITNPIVVKVILQHALAMGVAAAALTIARDIIVLAIKEVK